MLVGVHVPARPGPGGGRAPPAANGRLVQRFRIYRLLADQARSFGRTGVWRPQATADLALALWLDSTRYRYPWPHALPKRRCCVPDRAYPVHPFLAPENWLRFAKTLR